MKQRPEPGASPPSHTHPSPPNHHPPPHPPASETSVSAQAAAGCSWLGSALFVWPDLAHPRSPRHPSRAAERSHCPARELVGEEQKRKNKSKKNKSLANMYPEISHFHPCTPPHSPLVNRGCSDTLPVPLLMRSACHRILAVKQASLRCSPPQPPIFTPLIPNGVLAAAAR